MFRRRSVLALTAPLLGGAGNGDADARAALSPAQTALFETPHLEALRPPVRLDYDFRREEAGADPVVDTIRLEVRASEGQAGKRDVSAEFLTGPRAIRYPPARGFGGNPLLVFALDRDTRELSAATGGSALWFRNRFRQALANSAELRRVEIEHGGSRVPATFIALKPYAGESRAGRYAERRYAFTLSDAVPGSFQSVRTELSATADRGAVVESITFAGTAPLPDGGAG